MSSSLLLRISNLTIFYGNQTNPALNNFSINISHNGIYLIAGNSGSGKSTLAKSLLNLLPDKSKVTGNVDIDDQIFNLEKRNNSQLNIGFLPQFPMDYVLNLLVRDEIAFPLENLGFSKDDIENSINDILQKLNIQHLKNRIVTELSSGELQKVALATALVTHPNIIILDEPFARIDSTSELNLIEILRELKKNSIIFVLEHHLDYILELSDQVIILDKGSTIASGTPYEIISQLKENKPEIGKIVIPPEKTNYVSYSLIVKDLELYLQKKIQEGKIIG